jgi:hypothetical protein
MYAQSQCSGAIRSSSAEYQRRRDAWQLQALAQTEPGSGSLSTQGHRFDRQRYCTHSHSQRAKEFSSAPATDEWGASCALLDALPPSGWLASAGARRCRSGTHSPTHRLSLSCRRLMPNCPSLLLPKLKSCPRRVTANAKLSPAKTAARDLNAQRDVWGGAVVQQGVALEADRERKGLGYAIAGDYQPPH